jgi:16S rRNA (cytosine1402-N4)-methyltransferase
MFDGENEIFFGNFSVPFKTIGKLIVPNANEIKRIIEQEVPSYELLKKR